MTLRQHPSQQTKLLYPEHNLCPCQVYLVGIATDDMAVESNSRRRLLADDITTYQRKPNT